MTTKQTSTKKKTPTTKQNDETAYRQQDVAVNASLMNAAIIEPYIKTVVDGVPLTAIAEGLKSNIKEVQAGDMASMEAMLVAQAQSLQTMFVSLGRKAVNQSGLAQYTAMMNLALKAQSQSRATIQALTELKYPKQATFVKQANISNGHQQVNNGGLVTATPAKENQNPQNKLLEAQTNEWLDNGKTTTPSATHQAMETVAT